MLKPLRLTAEELAESARNERALALLERLADLVERGLAAQQAAETKEHPGSRDYRML